MRLAFTCVERSRRLPVSDVFTTAGKCPEHPDTAQIPLQRSPCFCCTTLTLESALIRKGSRISLSFQVDIFIRSSTCTATLFHPEMFVFFQLSHVRKVINTTARLFLFFRILFPAVFSHGLKERAIECQKKIPKQTDSDI